MKASRTTGNRLAREAGVETRRVNRAWNVCAVDGFEFFTVNLDASEIGVMVFMSPGGEIAFLQFGVDLIIDEVWMLQEEICAANRAGDLEPTQVFQAILTATVDPAPSREPYYAWAEVPCPNCGSLRRSMTKPTREGICVPDTQVTHARWEQRSAEERRQLAADAVAAVVRDGCGAARAVAMA